MRNIKNSVRAGVYAPISDNVWGKAYHRIGNIVNKDVWNYIHNNINHMTNNNIRINIQLFAEKEL